MYLSRNRGIMCNVYFTDTQVVPYVFRATWLGRLASGAQNHLAEETSSSASCRTSRDLFLHHYGMAELAFGEAPFLVYLGGDNRESYQLQTQSRRSEMGAEAFLRINNYPSLATVRSIVRSRHLTYNQTLE